MHVDWHRSRIDADNACRRNRQRAGGGDRAIIQKVSLHLLFSSVVSSSSFCSIGTASAVPRWSNNVHIHWGRTAETGKSPRLTNVSARLSSSEVACFPRPDARSFAAANWDFCHLMLRLIIYISTETWKTCSARVVFLLPKTLFLHIHFIMFLSNIKKMIRRDLTGRGHSSSSLLHI